MKLDNILNEWREDSKIDLADLGKESANVPTLHHKYLKMLLQARKYLRQIQLADKKNISILYDYYLGDLNNKEDLEEINRVPWERKILSKDIPRYLDKDKDVIKIKLKVLEAQNCVDALESIINEINRRGFHIKSAIDWERMVGGM